MESEERGVAEAIALNLREMMMIEVPIIVIVCGEGGSGGALGIAIGDRVLMQEFAVYSVIPPEGCAAILWRDANRKVEAAAALKITAPGPDRARTRRRHHPGADRRRAQRLRHARPRSSIRRSRTRCATSRLFGTTTASIAATRSSAAWATRAGVRRHERPRPRGRRRLTYEIAPLGAPAVQRRRRRPSLPRR